MDSLFSSNSDRIVELNSSRYQSVFEKAAAGIMIISDEGICLDANPAACHLLGYRREEVVGQPTNRFIPHEPDLGQEAVRRKLFEEGTGHVEFPLVQHSGALIYLDWHITVFDEGTRLCVVTDITERKRSDEELRKAQEALRQSEDRYRTLFDLSAVGQEELDPVTGRFLAVNRTMCEITGYSREELLGMTYLDVTHPEDREADRERYQTYLTREQEEHVAVKRFVRKDGSIRWVEVRAGLVQDGEGPMRSVGTVIDITERREAEEARHRSEEQLRLITDSVPILISYLDKNQRYQFNNASYERWFGIRRKDIKGQHIRNVVGEIAYKAIQPYLRMALSGKRASYETELSYSSGRRIVHADYVPHLVDGRVEGCYAVVSDITEQREAEIARQQSEERLRLVQSVAGIATYELNLKGDRLSNAWGWCELFAIEASRPEALEQFYRRVYAEDLSAFEAAIRRCVETGTADVEYRYRHPSRGHIWIYGLATRVETSSGTPVLTGVSIDITDRKRMEQELRDLNATLEQRVVERTTALEQSNRDLQSFAYVASHDLKEPLRKIQSFADLLKSEMDGAVNKNMRFYLERMDHAAARMSHLLSDVLTFSRVGTRTEPFEPVTVQAIIHEVLSDLELAIEEAGAEIDVDAEVSIEVDANQLRQLLNHLVMNAIKFRRKDVPPRVRITADTSGDIENVCRIVVEDNGIGFEEKYAERIFEPFQRLHGRSEYPGTGMGLAICRRIVERHGGSIRAESMPGEGSRFIIELPVRQEIEV